MPQRFALGNTNIVSRPSRNGAELLKSELDAGVEGLERKARRWRPEAVCLVGKGIWRACGASAMPAPSPRPSSATAGSPSRRAMGVLRDGDDPDDVEDGVAADPEWKGARIFVASARAAWPPRCRRPRRRRSGRELGVWVERRREERGITQ